ncbi:hypothetical protein [Rhodococcus sp. I2R]|uniref:hypothetical protein n=1 Tax=Rhodococcus sp. I2R TaxID=2855445 RepID=UPI0011150DCF|nr:hypothetical protein [Rhodococcus sp. I2R]MCC8928657.1 hypothetical protein [Rhodococcus sp. I2R]
MKRNSTTSPHVQTSWSWLLAVGFVHPGEGGIYYTIVSPENLQPRPHKEVELVHPWSCKLDVAAVAQRRVTPLPPRPGRLRTNASSFADTPGRGPAALFLANADHSGLRG